MNPEQPKHHRNELTAVNTRMIEDAVRIAETKAIIAGANEQIEALSQEGHHDVVALLTGYRDAAEKEYTLRESLREQARLTTKRELLHDDADAQSGSTLVQEFVHVEPRPGVSDATITTLRDLIEQAFAQREFYHQALQEQFPNENLVINKKLREMKNDGPLANIPTSTS